MKDTVHPPVHPSVHPAARASVTTTSPCRSSDAHFGRGQNTGLGWNDPGFSAFSRPKILPGRSRPMLVCGARAFLANARQPRSLPTEFQFWMKWASRYTFTLATSHHGAGVTACVSPRERVLSNKQCAAPHTTCPTRLHYERRRVLVTLKGTTQGH